MGVRFPPPAWRKSGAERREARERARASQARPAREASSGPAWAAGPRPGRCHGAGRGRAPGRSPGPGLGARGAAGPRARPLSLARARPGLRGCSGGLGPGLRLGRPPGARAGPLSCSGAARACCLLALLGCLPFGTFLAPGGRPREEAFFVCWGALVPVGRGRPNACWVLCLQCSGIPGVPSRPPQPWRMASPCRLACPPAIIFDSPFLNCDFFFFCKVECAPLCKPDPELCSLYTLIAGEVNCRLPAADFPPDSDCKPSEPRDRN